jgi:hypothetical protein
MSETGNKMATTNDGPTHETNEGPTHEVPPNEGTPNRGYGNESPADQRHPNESPTNEGPRRVRASDRERERVASILRAAAAEGLLTLPEVDERLATAYAARYRDELDPLTADLPDGGRPLYAGSPEGTAQRAELRAWARVRLVRHGAVVGLLAAVAVTAWALSGADHFFPAPILFLGVLSLVLHARRLGWSGPGWSGPGWAHPGWTRPGWSGPGWPGPAPVRPERRPER